MANKDIKQPPGVMLGIGFGIIIFACVILFVGISNANIYFPYLAAVAYTVIAFPFLNIVIGLVYKFTGHYTAARVHLIVGVSLTALLVLWWAYNMVIAS